MKQLPDGTCHLDLSSAAIIDLTILKGAPISQLSVGKTAEEFWKDYDAKK